MIFCSQDSGVGWWCELLLAPKSVVSQFHSLRAACEKHWGHVPQENSLYLANLGMRVFMGTVSGLACSAFSQSNGPLSTLFRLIPVKMMCLENVYLSGTEHWVTILFQQREDTCSWLSRHPNPASFFKQPLTSSPQLFYILPSWFLCHLPALSHQTSRRGMQREMGFHPMISYCSNTNVETLPC